MKIAVIGAGFTGLTAVFRLLQKGHQVTLFEARDRVGGLAAGFCERSWEWPLEMAYHHCFISDQAILNLAQELNQKMIRLRPETNIYVKGSILPIDSPTALLKFPHLPLFDRLRTGAILGYLKYLGHLNDLSRINALPWLRKTMGGKAADLIWEPLFTGKFGKFKEEISLTWFWGRIKKRSPILCYPEGGYQTFAENIAEMIKNLGGQILLNNEVRSVTDKLTVYSLPSTAGIGSRKSEVGRQFSFDKIIVTVPTPVFLKMCKGLPAPYIKRLSSIPHLYAQNLILILKKPFLKTSYWLNINDPGFPFLLLAEHTNFMDPKHYGGQHILYIGNYLPEGHPYLKKSASELLKIFTPYLKKINPGCQLSAVSCRLFTQPFAQPVMDVGYLSKIPEFKTPLKNVFLANMDMVYPWDRETNYAVEMGEKITEKIDELT